MASRNFAGPPPPGQGPVRHAPSPRRQVAVRLPTSVPASSVPTEIRRDYPSAAMLAAVMKSAIPEDINPKIAEIQSRVEELVRRYDDAVAAVDHEEFDEDEDDTVGGKRARTPARWRVGDVLLSTHRSLARTSTHTERTIVAEFGDDPEVSAAMGSEAQKVGHAFAEATEQATRRHRKLSHIHQVLQSVTANGASLGDSDEEDNCDKPPSPALREHQLRSTIDALHREKDAMTAQLQEALRLQQESRVTNEQQAQELTKAQRALRAQAEELRITHEHNEKATEAANALMASWRDKFQVSAKAAAVAEAKVLELETKVRAQSEEIMKHTFVLQTKIQEMERFKESEATRSRAEATAHAAALAEAEAETRRVKAKALEVKRKTKISIDGNSKELQEFENKIRELEGTLLAVENAKQELEEENTELSRRLREVQARFGEHRRFRPSVREDDSTQPETISAPVSTFALRLREDEPRINARKRERGRAVNQPNAKPSPVSPMTSATSDEDNISSSESEAEVDDSDNDDEFDEVEQDERELNRVMLQVVATVFPVLLPAKTDSALDESIAAYEDPTRSPLNEIQPSSIDAPTVASGGDMVSRSELDTLRSMFNHEVDALKQQYVDGLLEYKSLVLEQYGRRQAIERERHRLEIEGLLRLIQTKFHAELGRRSGRLKHAKQSLKVLYNALRQHSGPAIEPQNYEEDPKQPYSPVMPLKTLLRAAILAMSTSRKRQGRGRTQINAIHDHLTKALPSPDTRTRAVAAAMTIHSAIGSAKSPDTKNQDACSQTESLSAPRELRVEVTTDQRVEPESLDGYVLPGSPCFPSRKKQQDLVMLHLAVGIPFSDVLVAELRRMLPSLPPGNYHVSSALRLALFHELVRFYAAVEVQAEATKTHSSPRVKRIQETKDQIQEAEVVIGSPRNTPFLRRKALETIESKTRQRNSRHLFTSGGVAILQTAFTSTSTSTR